MLTYFLHALWLFILLKYFRICEHISETVHLNEATEILIQLTLRINDLLLYFDIKSGHIEPCGVA